MKRTRRRRAPRVAVYAIARDEAHNVERWAACARDADLLVIADTGSEDDTIDLARALGVEVHQIQVEPFRFDVARNEALTRVPSDVDLCVSLDLDEVLCPGWRAHLEAVWSDGATRVRHVLQWRWSEIHPPLRYTAARIHARQGYRWRFPVHEELVSAREECIVKSPIEIHHLRDPGAPRPAYLDLLRLAVTENPDDGRLAHMLANEARAHELWEEARYHARRALELPLEPFVRMHTLLMRSWLEPEHRESMLLVACAEFPDEREPWCELARLHAERGDWWASRNAAMAALAVTTPPDHYLMNVFAWGHWPEQLAATASARLGERARALHHARRALAAAPDDPVLAEHVRALLTS